MSTQREAWRIDRAGSLERLRRVSEPIAPPGPGEARIAVAAVGLNFADIFACLGLYSATPKGSFVPGLEFAGVVEGLGPPLVDDVSGMHGRGTAGCAGTTAHRTVLPGARVVGLTRFGAYTTALNLDTRYLRALPDSWSFEQGAAFPVQALTAWYGLVRLARVERDEVVLVHSAAGGVGLNALQILRKLGARAISTVGHPSKREFLVAHAGAEPASIIVRDPGRFGAQLDTALQAAGANGLDTVFDAIAGPYFTAAYERLRPEGRHVVYGAAHFMTRGARPNYFRLLRRYLQRPRLDPVRMIAENRSVLAFNLIWLWHHVERLASGYAGVDALITDPPFVGRTFSFEDVPAAMRWLQRGGSVGKVVVTPRGAPGAIRPAPGRRA